MSHSRDPEIQQPAANPGPDEPFIQAWTAHLLAELAGTLPGETGTEILKACAVVHYRALQMEPLVAQFRGNLPGFVAFLEEKWQWKVTYDPVAQVITADENKPACVCPIVRAGPGPVSPILCHCSEGFAGRMFSTVVDKPVKAEVMKSILRGDPSCVYRIQIFAPS